jgi:hypothetical protein
MEEEGTVVREGLTPFERQEVLEFIGRAISTLLSAADYDRVVTLAHFASALKASERDEF